MKMRTLGTTGIKVSEVGLGCWQLGGDWGEVSEKAAFNILQAAVDSGVTFFDTADVYGAGRSERFLGEFFRNRSEKVFFATKIGRDAAMYPNNYTKKGIRTGIQESIARLGVEALDLVQLHCIPLEVMQERKIFQWLRDIKREGLIKEFGASVESMEEAKLCMQQKGLCSLQIIFNIFRQKPIFSIFEEAKQKNIALIIRLPLASGLLSGKFSHDTTFGDSDHRAYNREGQFFNVGETFAGIPFEKGIDLVEELEPLVPKGVTMAQWAMRWILDFNAVSVVIPGATRPEQVKQNARASELEPIKSDVLTRLKDFYDTRVKYFIRGPY